MSSRNMFATHACWVCVLSWRSLALLEALFFAGKSSQKLEKELAINRAMCGEKLQITDRERPKTLGLGRDKCRSVLVHCWAVVWMCQSARQPCLSKQHCHPTPARIRTALRQG